MASNITKAGFILKRILVIKIIITLTLKKLSNKTYINIHIKRKGVVENIIMYIYNLSLL